MTARRVWSVWGIFILACFLPTVVVSPVRAESAAYESALAQVETLAKSNFEQENRGLLRQRAALVAEALKHLSFTEGETRAADKVAPPLSATARPGKQPERPLMDQAPGDKVALSRVPNEWFIGTLDIARQKTSDLLALLDSGQGDAGRYRRLANEIREAVRRIVHPPKMR